MKNILTYMIILFVSILGTIIFYEIYLRLTWDTKINGVPGMTLSHFTRVEGVRSSSKIWRVIGGPNTLIVSEMPQSQAQYFRENRFFPRPSSGRSVHVSRSLCDPLLRCTCNRRKVAKVSEERN